MKVGHHVVHDPKLVGWSNEQSSFAKSGGRPAPVVDRRFERSDDRRADGDDRPPVGARLFDRGDGDFRNLVSFFVHVVFVQAIDLNWPKCAGSHVQCHIRELVPRLAERCKRAFGEMETRRWRGHRTRLAGVDGLVALLVGSLRGATNVRGKWHVAGLLDQRGDVAFRLEIDLHPPLVEGADDTSPKPPVAER